MDRFSPVEAPFLSILIITRNTVGLLKGLIASLENDKEIWQRGIEIIVVDNGSTDGTAEFITASFPQITLLKNDTNRGFAAAVNQGWHTARGEIVLLLNSDTCVLPNEIARVIDFMAENPQVGVAGPALVYEDLSPQRSFASVPSLIEEMVPKFLLELAAPRRRGGKTWGSRTPEPVESLIGAALFVKRSVLEELGGFDERFFFFLEETDFCVRAKQAGWQVMFLPSARIIHYQGRTVGANWVKGRIEYNISLDKFIRKHHGGLYHKAFRLVRASRTILTVIGSVLVFPLLLLSGSARRRHQYRTRLLSWYGKGCPDDGGLREQTGG
jgi:GT2 family glycosyltransferase